MTDGPADTRVARPQAGSAWLGWPLVGAGSVAAGLVVMAAALLYGGGGPQRALPGLSDPGTVTPWALPGARVLADGGAVVTVGLLVAAAVLVSSPGDRLSGAAHWYVRAAGLAAAVWAVATVVAAVFTVSDILGRPVTELPGPGPLTDLAQSRALLLTGVLALGITVASVWVRGRTGAATLLVVAVAAVLPPSFTGHAAEAGDHGTAVSSLVFHLVGVTVWVGGLFGLLTYASRRPGEGGGHDRSVSQTARRQALHAAARRFSAIAGVCVGVVAASGAVNAWVRLGSLTALFGTAYGRLVLAKTVAVLVLAVMGYWHRRSTLEPIARGRRGAFLRLATAEVLIMAATIGLAVGLSRTPI
ncbi:MAG TPA: CopD family protein [Mycobacteriales bacterium]|nr:CopD family protein [Mycobacteriales bacterium]